MVEEHFGAAIIGGPETVERELRAFIAATQADELMLHSEFYRLEDRLRSYEIVANLFLKRTP
jgi:alkanesulfonate monooxygenase SsuD/methylene tetrahydromethanopterin reductase-like flavin-dependent oxidoreductase (luciferase family)